MTVGAIYHSEVNYIANFIQPCQTPCITQELKKQPGFRLAVHVIMRSYRLTLLKKKISSKIPGADRLIDINKLLNDQFDIRVFFVGAVIIQLLRNVVQVIVGFCFFE